MRRQGAAFACNLEDTRLFGMGPDDFAAFLSVVDELAGAGQPVFLDEVQEVDEWQKLVRALLDRGRAVCVTGSNASLLGRELGTKLTGRHLSFEVFPFSYPEYRAFTGTKPGRRVSANLARRRRLSGIPVREERSRPAGAAARRRPA